MVLTLKKKKDDKKTIKLFAIFIIIVFVSSVFIVFVQDNSTDSGKQFYIKIQVKDYTNPLQGNVLFVEGYTLREILTSYNIFINETCITLDYMYCNEGNYTWNLYVNDLTGETIDYPPKEDDEIIFKYEKI